MTTYEEWLEIQELLRDQTLWRRWPTHRQEQLERVFPVDPDTAVLLDFGSPERWSSFAEEFATWHTYVLAAVGKVRLPYAIRAPRRRIGS